VEAIIIPIIIIVVAANIAFRLAAGDMDRERLRRHLEERGAELLEAKWTPFGPGWRGNRDSRLYEIRYLDQDRDEHHALCKTNLWSGVYLKDDTVVRRAEHRDASERAQVAELMAENERLRQELARLRDQQGSGK
jgi:hypothetical protein